MMEETTTPDGGAQVAQPTDQSVAVDAGQDDGALVISTDENGTPSMTPVSSEAPTGEAASEEEATQSTEAQADTDDEIVAWAEKKGLNINPENPNEVKLARMQLETDRRFHESRQNSPQPPEELPLTGVDENYDAVAERLNRQEQLGYVRDWFGAHPDASNHREELQQIAADRPWLTNMDDVYAHFLANPSREAELRRDGGRQALTDLAQKQQQRPPQASATNSQSFQSQTITPQNVYELVDNNDQAWFEKNHDAISKAMSGR